MNSLRVLSFLLVVVAVSCYDSAHDDFEIKDVVNSVIALKHYNHCFIGSGECNEVGAFFKPFIADAVRTACANCTKAQQRLAHRYLEALELLLPEEYDAFKRYFDPEGKYIKAYRIAIAKASL